MRVHKMTKWDAGQCLIKCSDTINEEEHDLRDDYPELAEVLHDARMRINEAFNKFESHRFGLPDSINCRCKRCLAKKGKKS